MSPKKEDKSPTFEESLEALESIVDSMESGEIPLDELIKQFETGTQHLKNCQNRLKQAELKIETLKNSADGSSLDSSEDD